MNYSVEQAGSITASVGFAQSAGLILGGFDRGTTSWVRGNRVSIGLTRSQYQSRYNFGYVDPYWTADGVSLKVTTFLSS